MNETIMRYAFVFLTDRHNSTRLAVRVDQIVAIVPLPKPPATLVALVDCEPVMVEETVDEVLEAMVKAFRGPGDT